VSDGATYEVTSTDHERVRVLTLTRPDKLNAFTPDGYRRLRGALEDAATDDDVAVCVLTGAGRAFSSGVDLKALGQEGGGAALSAEFDLLLAALASFEKPLAAAVNGLAVGFGATLLLHCDLVVIDETATIRLPFAQIGTAAEAGSSYLLPLRVGPQHAARWIFSAEAMTAADAVAIGFALEQAPAGTALETTLALVAPMAGHHLQSLIVNKRLLRAGWADAIKQADVRERAAAGELSNLLGGIGWT
jgi:enoyl-CoA hydratase/carnithine racemase